MWEDFVLLWIVVFLGIVGLINIRKLDEYELGSELKGKFVGSVVLCFYFF